MKKGSLLSDVLSISFPLAMAKIDKEIKSKRKSKAKDEAFIALRDLLIARYPLRRVR